MRLIKIILLLIVSTALLAGCSSPSVIIANEPDSFDDKEQAVLENTSPGDKEQTVLENTSPDGQGVLHFTVMVHLEGWGDDENEDKFIRHALLVREYADLFEKYGAVLTLESREFTAGCIKWNDNVLKEMEQRGHGIGVHADIGGSTRTTQKQMETGLAEMKQELESLGVSVRHVSGVCSDKDWVTACLKTGFEAATGIVSYALWSLDEEYRPEGFEPYESPAEGHAAYPWDDALCVAPWYAGSGTDWIFPKDSGLVLIPSGIALTAAYEDSTGDSNGAGTFVFDDKDIEVWREKIDEVLEYTDSRQVNTYYAAYSLGSPLDIKVLERWLLMIDEYVQQGRIVWTSVPEMIELYTNK